MKLKHLCFLFVVAACLSAWPQDQEQQQSPPPPPPPPQQGGDFSVNMDGPKVPEGVILVKGAWASASDSQTPVPEDAAIVDSVFNDRYFGMSFALPSGWIQKYTGPPPSDSGRYVLAQLRPGDDFKGTVKGTVLIMAQDLFFSFVPAENAVAMVKANASSLQPDIYKVEKPPAEITFANRSFVRMDYMSPAAELHWYTFSTEIRCHTVQFIMTSRDTALLDKLIQSFNKMKLPENAGATTGTGGGDAPVCVKDYASGPNVLTRVEPVLPPGRFNSIPVRIIVGSNGKVKHVHLLSAFPEQAKVITDALLQWEFKPYVVNGQPVEVETGLMLGRAAMRRPSTTTKRQAVSAPKD